MTDISGAIGAGYVLMVLPVLFLSLSWRAIKNATRDLWSRLTF